MSCKRLTSVHSARSINGLTHINLTKLDVLSDLEEIKVMPCLTGCSSADGLVLLGARCTGRCRPAHAGWLPQASRSTQLQLSEIFQEGALSCCLC